MRRLKNVLLVGLLIAGLGSVVSAKPTIGQPAPDFSLTDADGKTHRLADAKGKFVVLEWFNAGCPFVQKHYESGNMQKLQSTYTAKGVTWYSILSSAPGKEGYVVGAEAKKQQADLKSKATALLLDPKGEVGKLYGAKNTPHMFVIDSKGTLIYQGAIDNKPSTDVEDVPSATNYVAQALDQALSGKPVSTPETKPYGCSVKY